LPEKVKAERKSGDGAFAHVQAVLVKVREVAVRERGRIIPGCPDGDRL